MCAYTDRTEDLDRHENDRSSHSVGILDPIASKMIHIFNMNSLGTNLQYT